MITIEQIKAARSLLDWNQEELAKKSNISKPSLANLERREANPSKSTMDKIQRCLEEAGIEFLDNSGVKLSADKLNVQVFKGKDAMSRLWNDMYETLKSGEERLISSVDEKKYMGLGNKFDKMLERFEKKGIKGRVLALQGTKLFPDKTSEYRLVSKDIFLDTPYYVYGNKYAILIWEPEPRIVLIENKIIADTYRKQFERHWTNAKKPSRLRL